MRKTDISKFSNTGPVQDNSASDTARSIGKILAKALLTLLAILMITGTIVGAFLVSFIWSMKDETMAYDLNKLKLNYTSFIYVYDENGNPVEYQSLYSNENRVWVDYSQIPQAMKDAIVAIEDKRFWEHNGVDWRRTLGAVTQLFSEGSSYGGSTITQQLIKNVTGDKDVSLTRKVKEIFRALNLNKEYSREQILEAYLNVVNFGSGTNGVQAAANLYFGKDIQDCDIAECAAIAGITQNPSRYTPLVHPENNMERQQVVLGEMYDQGKITKAEYDEAMEKSRHMTFVGKKQESGGGSTEIWNWYVETMFEDVKEDLMELYSCTSAKAEDMIYHDGLKIYCAMDQEMQSIAESFVNNTENLPQNQEIDLGYIAMDYDGRVLAVVGAREKTRNRPLNLATDAQRQPGSTIKPIGVYAPAIELGAINYSTIVEDAPLENWNGDKPGPNNFDNRYLGNMTVEFALENSRNAPAARICKEITPEVGYTFLKDKLHFTSLQPADNNIAPIAIGGMSEGVTVREMTAAFQIFANGGKFTEPYTYYYVEDHDGNVILDNRNKEPVQAISSTTSSIMHHLLNRVITGSQGSGRRAAISGWEVFGKTGTTNDQKDSWFIGGTPYALAGIWTGYRDTPTAMNNTETKYAISIWQGIMSRYLENKEPLEFTYDENVVSATFCQQSGKLATGSCPRTGTGWYQKDEMPERCDMEHPVEGDETSSAGEEGETPEGTTPTDPATSSQVTEPPTDSSVPEETEPVPETPSQPSQVPPQEPEGNTDNNVVVTPGDDTLPPGIVPVG